MAVLQMQKIHICATKKNRKKILELLQRKGVVQIHSFRDEDEMFRRTDTSSFRADYERYAVSAEQSLEILNKYSPEKKGMLSSLNGKKQITEEEYDEITRKQEDIIHKASKIIKLQKLITESQANAQKIIAQKESLVPWLSLDVPISMRGTRKTSVFIGTLPGRLNEEEITLKLSEQLGENDVPFDTEVISADDTQTCIFVICNRDFSEITEEALRSIGFSRPSISSKVTPEEQTNLLEKDLEEEQKKAEEYKAKIVALSEIRSKLEEVCDYYKMRADKYEVLGELLQSKHVFFIDGYIPKREADGVQKELTENFDCVVEFEDIKESEKAPVLLQNNAFTAPTEGVLESFGLPKKGEIDPTPIMSVFYYLLFGLMLSDAAYGFIMALGCFICVKKFPNMSDGIQKMMKMLGYCGLSTMFWGILFGSYFGDAVQVISSLFFGKEVAVPALWFVPLDEPMRMLIYCFLFGLIHLFTGLAIKGYMAVRDKRWRDFFGDFVLWVMLLGGLLIMLLPSQLFASISQMEFNFSATVVTIGKVSAILGAVGILLMDGRDSKNWFKRLAKGAYGLYGVTSWLSDVLSYSRLLALGLATGVIASVINSMGGMVVEIAGKFVGGIFFAVIFIGGHLFNLAINVLGAYVHTNRLQFVEFFGKFYEGGGEAFNPFKANTKYVNIKEETK